MSKGDVDHSRCQGHIRHLMSFLIGGRLRCRRAAADDHRAPGHSRRASLRQTPHRAHAPHRPGRRGRRAARPRPARPADRDAARPAVPDGARLRGAAAARRAARRRAASRPPTSPRPIPRSWSGSSRARPRCTATRARWPAAPRTLCRLLVERYDGRPGEPVGRARPTAPPCCGGWASCPDSGRRRRRSSSRCSASSTASRRRAGGRPPATTASRASRRSVADITGPESLVEVRAFKQEQKQAAKAARQPAEK